MTDVVTTIAPNDCRGAATVVGVVATSLRSCQRQGFLILALFCFLNDCLRSVPRYHPACRPGHYGFILKPQKSEVIDALRKIRLDNDVSWNHSARNVGIVRAIVAVGHRLRN